MAIAATTGATNNITSSTLSCVVTVTLTAGRCAIVVCATKVTGQTVASVVDSGGSTYSKLAGAIDDGGQSVEIWGTTATGTTSSTTVTVTWNSGASGRKGALVEEYSGVVAIGTNATNSGTGTNPTVTRSTQDANNYIVAGLSGTYDASITASVGTVRQTVNAGTNLSAVLMDNTVASAGSLTCTGTQGVSAAWVAAAIELRSVVTFTATASLTGGSTTLAASATFAAGTKTASAALSGGATTLAASASRTNPVYTASASLTGGSTTLAASVQTPTRTYISTLGTTPPINPTPSASWNDTSDALADAMLLATATAESYPITATLNGSDPSLAKQLISRPLVPGQVLSSQTISAQFLCRDVINGAPKLTLGVRVLASDGTTIRRTMLALTNSTNAMHSSVRNLTFSAAASFTDYTTVAGDRLVVEVGADVYSAGTGFVIIEFGSDTGVDLPVDETTTTNGRPWIEFSRNIQFASDSAATVALSSGSTTLAASAAFAVPTRTASAGLTSGSTTLAASATHTAPVYTAAATLTTGSTALAASATYGPGTRTASAGLVGSGTTLSAAVAVTNPSYTAAATLTTGSTTLAAIATSQEVFSATAALSGGSTTLAASAVVTNPVYTAAATLTTGSTTLNATAQSVVIFGGMIWMLIDEESWL